MRISLRCVKEVTVAALQGVTVRQRAEGRDDVADGRVDDVQCESRCDLVTIAPESGVVHEPLGLRKGFHLNNTESVRRMRRIVSFWYRSSQVMPSRRAGQHCAQRLAVHPPDG
jgi:hypothetical protein